MRTQIRSDRVTTEPERFFVQCAPLPVRGERLSAEQMKACVGGINPKVITPEMMFDACVAYTIRTCVPPPWGLFAGIAYTFFREPIREGLVAVCQDAFSSSPNAGGWDAYRLEREMRNQR